MESEWSAAIDYCALAKHYCQMCEVSLDNAITDLERVMARLGVAHVQLEDLKAQFETGIAQ